VEISPKRISKPGEDDVHLRTEMKVKRAKGYSQHLSMVARTIMPYNDDVLIAQTMPAQIMPQGSKFNHNLCLSRVPHPDLEPPGAESALLTSGMVLSDASPRNLRGRTSHQPTAGMLSERNLIGTAVGKNTCVAASI
jgi:hypothetical protein